MFRLLHRIVSEQWNNVPASRSQQMGKRASNLARSKKQASNLAFSC
uniref:Uncharacterized protein n=1 Tax=Arundo donax TaxID=35708 RepID=A0A0A9CA02_ARUDO